jgi:hypothetical protein
MSNDYVLFYSDKCLHSKELINLLYKDQDLFKKFVKINIDVAKVNIPPYIKSVPSAIITENNNAKLLVGVQIFNWYNENHKVTLNNNQVLEWDPLAMAGYSDGFSYIENSTAATEKNYLYLNDANDYRIHTPEDNNSDKKSNDNGKTQIDYNYEKFMMQRDSDVGQPVQRM